MHRMALPGGVLFVLSLGICLPTVADGPVFDAASIASWSGDFSQNMAMTGGPDTKDPGRFRAPRISLSALLARAFGVRQDQLSGPAWLRDTSSRKSFFSLTATMPPNTTKEDFRKMLQNLLADRFHLIFHHETRSFPGYELIVDKGGPLFKEDAPVPAGGATTDSTRFSNDTRWVDGFPDVPGPRVITMSTISGVERRRYQQQTMADFVSDLGVLIGSSQDRTITDGYPQPRVVDKTGLPGTYTFVLEYYNTSMAALSARLRQAQAERGDGRASAAAEPEQTGPDIFHAIQQQLGLRLVKTDDVPTDVIIVDSIDKLPAAN